MKKALGAVFALILSFCLHAQIPTNGMIGGWPFTGNANDMSGSNNHGTVFGASLTTDRFGAANSAYSFNGSGNYIVMGSAGPTGTVSRSVSFWAKTTYSNGISVGFNYGDAVGTGGIYQIMFNYNCQGVGFDNSNAYLIRGGSIVNNNQWHHIVAVINATNSTLMGGIEFYIDGVLQTSVSCGSTSSPINSNALYPITIGKSCNSSLRYFNGKLDDFYAYNRAITYAEVQQLYNFTPCLFAPSTPSAVLGNTLSCQSAGPVSFSISPVVGASSYTWSLPAGWTVTNGTLVTTSASPYTGTIGVAAVNPCGESAYNIISVNVNKSVPVNITASSSSICAGGVATLSASGANTFLWNSGGNAPLITVSPLVTTAYTVTGTDLDGCTGLAVTYIYVTNGPIPVISISTNGTKCAGQPVSIAANGATSYTWQPGSLTGFLVTTYPTSQTIYTVTGAGQNGCIGTTTFTQEVFGVPSLSASTSATKICENQAVSLGASGASSYTWFPGGLTGFMVSVTPLSTTNYTVYGTDPNNCVGQTTVTQVVIKCAGVGEAQDLQKPSVYPNPFSGSIRVTSDKIVQRLWVVNMIGSIVYDETQITDAGTDLSSLSSGTYLLFIQTDSGQHVQKIVKIPD